MKRTFTRFTKLILCLLLSAVTMAQEANVWPGDASDNGTVDEVDLLYWAHTYGFRGDTRPDATTAWVGQRMGIPWPDTFPSGHNFAYTDANGDGRVTKVDLATLQTNFGSSHSANVGRDPWALPDTTGNYAAVLQLQPTGVRQVADGAVLVLDVVLNGRDSSFNFFQSLAVRATAPATLLRDYALDGYEISESGLSSGRKYLQVVRADSATAQLAFAVTLYNHFDTPVEGALVSLELPLAPGFSPDSLATIDLTIDSLILTDANFVSYPVAVDALVTATQSSCSFTVRPVCGINGVTYLNSCFAEAAGVTVYTEGACWNPGLSVAAMDPAADCPDGYDPVCGFNGVTYANACAAEAAGVTDYATGICDFTDVSCYDPGLIVVSSGTSVNQATGVISLVCANDDAPVCGCDGNEYLNACLAEAAGVRTYVSGGCDAACVDPTAITTTDDCGTATDFVCGCNGETYINACYAEAAGLQNYTAGPCNGTSTWCSEATVIECGSYLPNETTVGAGNQITSYPGATGVAMAGPDRVYVFEKTTAGDLQIGLEITTPGLNMDIFLLTGDCNNYTVVGSSTTANTATNNEGIVLNDAPTGTYYIVVDQASAGVGGNYRLELSCGYLDCSNRVPLSCGTPYNGTNAGGTDDVSTYTCGQTLNVENNGPEVVHTFTTTEAGIVTIDLTGLSSNLELFLLSECSRRSGLTYSQNPGTQPERITRFLPAGTWYVVVDGYNGAISNYTLTVDCSSACDLGVNVLATNGTSCGQSGGSITVQVTGGQPLVTAHYVGPVCRAATSTNGVFTFSNLPSGDYVTYFEDANGCEVTFPFTIDNAGGMAGTVTATPAGCGSAGDINVDMTTGGTPPYTIYLSGDLTRTFTTNSNSFTITPLAAGNYTVLVTDQAGCSMTQGVTVDALLGDLNVTTSTLDADCDGGLGEILVQAPNGALPYFVTVSGPVNGSASVNGYNFRIRTLPAGQYTFTLTDAQGCSYTEEVVIGTGALEVSISATAANCNLPGAALVTIGTGAAPYMINYTGPVTGSVTTSDASTIINGLPSGTYNFSVWGADGCDQNETVFVADGGGNLDLTVTQMLAACDGNDSGLQINIGGGSPNYTVTYTGTVTGTMTVGGTGVGSLFLPPGTYTFTATDFGGCSATVEMTVEGGLTAANQSSFAYGDGCGQLDNIRTLINGGEAPYEVTLFADACPAAERTFTSLTNIFDIEDLPNCTYTVAVTDANGCFSSQTVVIDVDPNADFLIVTPQDGSCGGTGNVEIEVTAGTYPYFLSWTGPASGSVNLASQTFLVTGLPAGTYVFSVFNDDGCEASQTITLLNDGDLDIVSSIVTDDCGRPDQIWNDIEGGTGPFTVEVIRLCDSVEVDVEMSGRGFEIIDLEPCDYKIKVTDANGCMTMTTITVPPYQFFDAIPNNLICGQPGSIEVNVMNSNATPPYTINYSGPVVGLLTSPTGSATIGNLLAGTYTVTVTDANGCTETEQVTLTDTPSDLDLQTAVINNECGQYNQLWNDIFGGVPPYTVTVTRLCDNTVDTTFVETTNGFELEDLDECCYEVKITDAQGCMVTTENCVEDESPNLVNLTPLPGPCGQNGRLDLSFIRGTAPYTVVYNGPVSGTNTVNGNVLSIDDAPPGTYTFTVTDANGCTETESTVLQETENLLTINTALISNECGQYNQIWIDILNGTGPYAITVTRLCDNTTLTEFVSGDVGFELTDLTPCDYKIAVTDAAGCMRMETVSVAPSSANLFDITMNESCDSSGFDISFIAGTPPYQVILSGPTSTTLSGVTEDLFVAAAPGDYMVRVVSAEGCSEMNFAALSGDGNGELPQVSFSSTTTDLTVAFTNTSSQGTAFSWDFGDGSPLSTEENPSHTYATPGNYEVCLTVSNGCGDAASCQTVELAATGGVQIVIGGASSFPGNSVRIPVSIQGTDNIATIAGTFQLDEPAMATITHVSAGAIEPLYNPATRSFSFVANETSGVSLPNEINVLFFVHLDLGTNTGTTDLHLVDSPVSLEVSGVREGIPVLMPATYLPGFVDITDNLTGNISSQAMTMGGTNVAETSYLLSEPEGSYVVELPVDGQGVASTISGINMGRMYYVEPVKTTDYRNGLSSFEIFLAQRYLLGLPVPQITHPLQVVALDMNCSQTFTTLDMYLMQRLLLEDNLDEIPGCNSWTFVPETHEFADDWLATTPFPAPRRAEIMLASDTMVMFTGVKTGDLLMDADPGRAAATLPLTVAAPATFAAGRTYVLTLNAAEAGDLMALQAELTVDERLEVIGVTATGLPGLRTGERLLDRGLLRLSWFSDNGQTRALNAGAGLVEIAVRARVDFNADRDLLRVSDRVGFRAEAHASTGRYRPTLSVATGEVSDLRVLSVAPVPAADYVDLNFTLPTAAPAEVTLLDGLGRTVATRRQALVAGTHRFRFDVRDFPAGVYQYRLAADGEVRSGKFVVQR